MFKKTIARLNQHYGHDVAMNIKAKNMLVIIIAVVIVTSMSFLIPIPSDSLWKVIPRLLLIMSSLSGLTLLTRGQFQVATNLFMYPGTVAVAAIVYTAVTGNPYSYYAILLGMSGAIAVSAIVSTDNRHTLFPMIVALITVALTAFTKVIPEVGTLEALRHLFIALLVYTGAISPLAMVHSSHREYRKKIATEQEHVTAIINTIQEGVALIEAVDSNLILTPTFSRELTRICSHIDLYTIETAEELFSSILAGVNAQTILDAMDEMLNQGLSAPTSRFEKTFENWESEIPIQFDSPKNKIITIRLTKIPHKQAIFISVKDKTEDLSTLAAREKFEQEKQDVLHRIYDVMNQDPTQLRSSLSFMYGIIIDSISSDVQHTSRTDSIISAQTTLLAIHSYTTKANLRNFATIVKGYLEQISQGGEVNPIVMLSDLLDEIERYRNMIEELRQQIALTENK
jgi:hypothetical protein